MSTGSGRASAAGRTYSNSPTAPSSPATSRSSPSAASPPESCSAPQRYATDELGRTALPGVYACGDVAASWQPSLARHLRHEHWTSAAAQATTVARTLLGHERARSPARYFWSDQFGFRLQHVGGDEPWAEITLDGTPDAFTARYVSADGRLVAALLGNRPQHVASLRREIATLRMTPTSIAS